jgi:hypothetical protein
MAKMRQLLTSARVISKASVRGISRNPAFARLHICGEFLASYIHLCWVENPSVSNSHRRTIDLRIARGPCRSTLPRERFRSLAHSGPMRTAALPASVSFKTATGRSQPSTRCGGEDPGSHGAHQVPNSTRLSMPATARAAIAGPWPVTIR